VVDGSLGAYFRKECLAKGVYVFPTSLETGFRHVTSYAKPMRSPDDFAGFKIRVLPIPLFVDLFKTLGAAPTPIDVNQAYTAIQTHLVDGQENPLVGIDGNKYFEIQRYLSLTYHVWSGEWMAANTDAWNALPPDIQAVVERNARKAALLVRRDIVRVNAALLDKLKREGMIANATDPNAFRARLAPYYARWKSEYGNTVWGLLEEDVGKLG
jgi:TRAP-type C4-dicarboxylate transport system substrate-binding protein